MFYFLADFKSLFFALNIFKYITFRAGMAAVTAFLLSIILGPWLIQRLRDLKVQEIAKRKDAPALDRFINSKEGTPTMGGLLIVGSVICSVLLWSDLSNPFILITLLTCAWLAALGGYDDYVKLTRRQSLKRGLSARLKLCWQVVLGLIVGIFIYSYPGTSTQLDVPFMKQVILSLGMLYIPFVALIVVGTSNAVNLTDGLDGLAIGCVLIVAIALGALSYITGNIKFSEYLFVPYIRDAGELTIFCAALVGASLGFLWFNCHPASVFMGDVGSLSLGGVLGVIAVLIKKELLLVILGGIFVLEALSVIMQVISFKTTGKRIFKMSPFHHHLQMSGWNESKIIVRFWIIAIILALLTLTTLKIR